VATSPLGDLGFGVDLRNGSFARWCRRTWDCEVAGGLVAVVAAISVPVLAALPLLASRLESATTRFVVVAGVALVAVAVVAAQWSRRWFLVFSGIAVALLAMVVVDIGWDSHAHVSARQLASALQQRDDLDKQAKEQSKQLTTAKEVAIRALETALDNASEGAVKSAAQPLVDVLKTSPKPAEDTAELVVELDRARTPADNLATTKLYDAAVAAVAAAKEAASYKPDGSVASETIRSFCSQVRSKPTSLKKQCDDTPQASAAQPAATLDVAIAEYRFAVDASDANKEALEAANEEAAALARGEEMSWLEAAGRATAEILPGRGLDSLVPGPVGWALLLAALFGFWSWQQRRNAQRQTGPVELSIDDKLPHFRLAVLHNLPEPEHIPGAEAIASVSSLTDLGGAPAAGVAKAVVGGLQLALGRTYGYLVEAEVIKPEQAVAPASTSGTAATVGRGAPAASSEPTRVMVRVRDRYTKKTIDTMTCSATDAKMAQRRAGYWAAGTVLARSRRQPSWLRWSTVTAEPLSRTRGERPALDELEAASRRAPDSALLLDLLGSSHELAGRQVDALQAYARAVTLAPRFPAARYRLAGSLGMLAGTPELWTALEEPERRRRTQFLVRAFAAMNHGDSWQEPMSQLAAPESTDQAKKALVELDFPPDGGHLH